MNKPPDCDICGDHPAEHVAYDPRSTTKVCDDSLGIGRVALFLCKVCVGGTIGMMVASAGMRLLELMK